MGRLPHVNSALALILASSAGGTIYASENKLEGPAQTKAPEKILSIINPTISGTQQTTDSGLVVGYRCGMIPLDHNGSGRPHPFIRIYIRDQNGETIRDSEEIGTPSNISTTPPTLGPPYINWMAVDTYNDRVIFDVWDSGVKRQWRIYRLSDGGYIRDFDPGTLGLNLCGASGVWIPAAYPIDETPLLAVHYILVSSSRQETPYETWIAVVDLGGNVVWKEPAKDDFTPFYEKQVKQIWRASSGYKHPRVVVSEAAHEFTVRSFANKEQVTYRVSRAEQEEWTVKPIRRAEFRDRLE